MNAQPHFPVSIQLTFPLQQGKTPNRTSGTHRYPPNSQNTHPTSQQRQHSQGPFRNSHHSTNPNPSRKRIKHFHINSADYGSMDYTNKRAYHFSLLQKTRIPKFSRSFRGISYISTANHTWISPRPTTIAVRISLRLVRIPSPFKAFTAGKMTTRVDGTMEYAFIANLFLGGMRTAAQPTRIVAVHRNSNSGLARQVRSHSFQLFTEALVSKHGGQPNVKYGCYGGTKDEILAR